MKGKKTYLQPADMVLNAIHDVGGMQKGQMTLCDSPRGLVGYRIMMRGKDLEYRFRVKDIGSGSSRVTIEIAEEKPDLQRLIDNEFALLDFALLDKAQIDLADMDEWDKKIEEMNRQGLKDGKTKLSGRES